MGCLQYVFKASLFLDITHVLNIQCLTETASQVYGIDLSPTLPI